MNKQYSEISEESIFESLKIIAEKIKKHKKQNEMGYNQ